MPVTSSSRSAKLAVAGILGLVLTACIAQRPKNPGQGSGIETLPNGTSLPEGLTIKPTLLSSSLPYLGKSKADQPALKARAADANTLHFALAAAMDTPNRQANVVYSGYSIQTAFGLLYPATAEGSVSSQEIVKALHFNEERKVFYDALLGQMLSIEEAFKVAGRIKAPSFMLVNQVWTDNAYGLQTPYSDTIKQYFNAGVGSLPFTTASEASRQTINQFVEHNTKGLIKDLLPEGSITSDTVSVLTNSIYMLADWHKPFEVRSTAPAEFRNSDGSVSKPPTMQQTAYFAYAEGTGYQALSMDYVGSKLAMLVVLPATEAKFSEFAAKFDAKAFDATLVSLKTREVNVRLPKFSFEFAEELTDEFQTMGLNQVFAGNTENFPHLLTSAGDPVKPSLLISGIYHKAKIIVDEAGTEGAAATGIGAEAVSMREIETFYVDRPALFFIYEKTLGSILFGGQLVKL